MSDLAGKDYFTVPEAAEYAGISVSHWRARIQRKFPPGMFYGKLLYRKADVQQFIESEIRWPRSTPAASVGTSTGSRADTSNESRSEESRPRKPTNSGSQKNSSLPLGNESVSRAPSLKIISRDI